MFFDFPKVRKKLDTYTHEDGNYKLETREHWGYKHADLSTEENIRKTGFLLMKLFRAHHEQNQ
jgi:hypothetical protein